MSDTTLTPARTYLVTVRGFEHEPVKISARTPSKARAQAWRYYLIYDDSCSFAKFLGMSSIKLIENRLQRVRSLPLSGGRP